MRSRSATSVGPFGRAVAVLSLALVVSSAVASVAALVMPQLVHGPAVMVGSMRGTALVIVVLGIPLAIVSVWSARNGALLGIVGWLAAVVFLTYQAWMFLFAVPFNGLFLVYVAMLSSGFWALVALLGGLDPERIAARPGSRMPVRLLAGWLIGSSFAFYALWLKNAVPALFASETPAFLAGTGMVTATNYVLDMAFFLPFTIAAAVALWRRTSWGVVVGGAMLVVLVLESVSIAVDQWLGAAADPGSPVASAALTPMFLVVAAIGFVMTGLWYRGVKGAVEPRTTATPDFSAAR